LPPHDTGSSTLTLMSKLTNLNSSLSGEHEPLPKILCKEIWTRITDRLQAGEPLLTTSDFVDAAEEVYTDFSASPITDSTRTQIRNMVEAVNSARPDTYLAKGFQNKVNSALEEGVKRLNWDLSKIQEKGAQSLRRFKQREEVRDLLDKVNLSADSIDVLSGVKLIVDQISGRRDGTPIAPKRDKPAPSPIADEVPVSPPAQTPAEVRESP
jgi:hypothetical protein